MLERILGILQGGVQPFGILTSGTPARVVAFIDILLVAALLYAAMRFLRRSRATHILVSLVAIALAILVARLLGLAALNALLTVFAVLLVVALPVLFQPELRRGLERLGRGLPLLRREVETIVEPTVAAVVEAVETLRVRRWGAIIVLERRIFLTEYADTGTPVGADVSAPLLEAVFSPESPLHDGAVIIRGHTVLAAGCTLPLAEVSRTQPLGTRHRAGQGITEVSDAVAVIVSEEKRAIVIAADGRLLTVTHPPDVRTILRKLLPSTARQ